MIVNFPKASEAIRLNTFPSLFSIPMVTNGIASPLIESVTAPLILQAEGAACAAVHNENINPYNIPNLKTLFNFYLIKCIVV